MTISLRMARVAASAIAAATVTALLGPASPGISAPSSSAVVATTRATPRVLHRIVWDDWKAGRPGIHLVSETATGDDRRRIYVSHRGFTMTLVLDRRGRRVAFAPCCHRSLPLLVVVPVLGGRVLEPLARHDEFYFADGIGWSPNGRRLVFQGGVRHGHRLSMALWTVHPNGTGLHRLLPLGSPRADDAPFNASVAWTRQGVLYSDGRDLRVVRHGKSSLLLRHVTAVRISGDGTRIVTDQMRQQRRSLWIGDADGTDQTRFYIYSDQPVDGWLFDPQPNHDGTRLLAVRDRSTPAGSTMEVITWVVAEGVDSATVLAELGSPGAVTWN